MKKKRRFVSTTDEEFEQKRLKMNAQKPLNKILLNIHITAFKDVFRTFH
jgi:hypothetical protein